ncbi:MAG: acetyl-CoA carboxylase, biotin carboxyl carrier protein, partial [Terriglobales bacterium]
MNQKELKELIEFLIEKDIAEFELERGDVKVRIKRGSEPVGSGSAPDTRFFTVHAAAPSAPELGTASSATSPP